MPEEIGQKISHLPMQTLRNHRFVCIEYLPICLIKVPVCLRIKGICKLFQLLPFLLFNKVVVLPESVPVFDEQLIFKRLSEESYQVFRQKQRRLFGEILENFGIKADTARVNLFTNLSLTAMVVRRAIPDTLPLFVPEAADETVNFQLDVIVNALEKWKTSPTS